VRPTFVVVPTIVGLFVLRYAIRIRRSGDTRGE
jgi:hypothetical protein